MTVVKNPLEEMEYPHRKHESEMQCLGSKSQKRQSDLCFQGKPFSITVIQVYAPTSNAEEAEVERFYEDLLDLLELTPREEILFII